MILAVRLGLLVLGLTLAAVATLAAANSVVGSRVGAASRPVTANDLKPPECAALNLTVVVVGGGSGGQAALVLGTAGNDNLTGAARGDCLVGGNGNDRLNGGPGVDVCIGGAGNDTFQACETQIQ